MAYTIFGFHQIMDGCRYAPEDIDFFSQAVGPRMIKQTVLFDGTAPVYHLHHDNRDAATGSVTAPFSFRQAGLRAC